MKLHPLMAALVLGHEMRHSLYGVFKPFALLAKNAYSAFVLLQTIIFLSCHNVIEVK
jgi:hypothetical protein